MNIISNKTSGLMEDPRRLPRHIAHTLQRNCPKRQSVSGTRPGINRRTTGVGGGAHFEGTKKTQPAAISDQVEGILGRS